MEKRTVTEVENVVTVPVSHTDTQARDKIIIGLFEAGYKVYKKESSSKQTDFGEQLVSQNIGLSKEIE